MEGRVLNSIQKEIPVPAAKKNDRRFRWMTNITIHKWEDHVSPYTVRTLAVYFSDKEPAPQLISEAIKQAVELHSVKCRIKHPYADLPQTERLLTKQGVYMCVQRLNLVLPEEVLQFYDIKQPPFYTPHYMDGMREALSSLKRVSPFYVNGVSFTDYFPEISTVVVDKADLRAGACPELVLEGMGIQVLYADISNIYGVISSIVHRRCGASD